MEGEWGLRTKRHRMDSLVTYQRAKRLKRDFIIRRIESLADHIWYSIFFLQNTDTDTLLIEYFGNMHVLILHNPSTGNVHMSSTRDVIILLQCWVLVMEHQLQPSRCPDYDWDPGVVPPHWLADFLNLLPGLPPEDQTDQLPHLLAVTAVLLLPAVVLEWPVSVSSIFRIFSQAIRTRVSQILA